MALFGTKTSPTPGASGEHAYRSDIVLGERYRDDQTGYEGVAVAIMFFQHACERVELETIKDDKSIIGHAFDAPRLTHIATGKTAKTDLPGGPGDSIGRGGASRASGLSR
jgi:hypothetical protein